MKIFWYYFCWIGVWLYTFLIPLQVAENIFRNNEFVWDWTRDIISVIFTAIITYLGSKKFFID